MGAPVGSVLLGNAAFVQKARRIRKVLGGGMRQAGYLAAACLYALEHHLPKLTHDHNHAKATAQLLEQQNWVARVMPVETNIVIFELADGLAATAVIEGFRAAGILALAISARAIRLVFHLDVSNEKFEQLNQRINALKF
jgi:threonine aldolase